SQSFMPSGQSGKHCVPSQSASPPVGAEQGLHEPPQVAGSSLSTQAEPHRCVPSGQEVPQLPSLHVASPLVGAGHGLQESPQLSADVSLTHSLPQRCVPGAVQLGSVAWSSVPPSSVPGSSVARSRSLASASCALPPSVPGSVPPLALVVPRSEERRVGKERGWRWQPSEHKE